MTQAQFLVRATIGIARWFWHFVCHMPITQLLLIRQAWVLTFLTLTRLLKPVIVLQAHIAEWVVVFPKSRCDGFWS